MAIRMGRPQKFPRKKPAPIGDAPLEKDIAGRVIHALRMIGCSVSSTQQTRASRQTIGMSDLWVSHAVWGVFCWMEVKRPGEKPTRVQVEWMDAQRAAGVPVLVVNSAANALEQFGALPRKRA